MRYLTDWFKVGAQLFPPQPTGPNGEICTPNHDIWTVKSIDFEKNRWEGVELSGREAIFSIDDMIGWMPCQLPRQEDKE